MFENFKLSSLILDTLKKIGYKTPTPIQEKAIPVLLEGRDLLGIAQTGTGKTAAFSLPILNGLISVPKKKRPGHVRVLIMAPTRELATQIADNIEAYSKGLNIRTMTAFGGVSERPQIMNIAKGVDILVATPGRLLDLISNGHLYLNNVEFFVLDEADRMLDMGFIRDVRKIVEKLPKKRQTLLFSATMPQEIASLSQDLLDDPISVEITPESTVVEKIAQQVIHTERKEKIKLLKNFLTTEKYNRVLVFSRTKHGANKIVEDLMKGSIQSAAIHGNKSQNARELALENFKSGKIKVLIATDIAARGIDINDISHVINFDIPDEPETYVHRIGRTARAGRDGIAISYCDETQKEQLKAVEKAIKMKIPSTDKTVKVAKPLTNPNLNKKAPAKKPGPKKNDYWKAKKKTTVKK